MYRSLLWSVYLPSFFMSLCQGSVLLVIPLYSLELGAGAGVASLVFALRGLGNMLADVPAGYATARLGDKHTMLLGISTMAVAAVLASQIESAFMLGAIAMLFGAATATWLLSRLSHISAALPAHQRGKAIATMAGVQRIGSLLGPVISGAIAVTWGYPAVFVFIACAALIPLLLITVFVRENIQSHHEDSPGILALVPHIVSRHYRIFATAGVAILCLTVLRAGRQLLIPLWGESLGLDASEIGLVMGMGAAVDMTMFPLAGYLLDNRGRRTAAIACMVILALGLLLVPFSDGFALLALAAMVAGLGNGLGSGINMTLGADFAPESERGEFLGVWRLMGDSGSFAGPIAMGAVANAMALATTFYVAAALGGIGILVMLLFVRETLVKGDITNSS